MLTLQNIVVARSSKPLIEAVSFSLTEKMIIGLVGSNGCGKTSLFEVLQGRLDPYDGEIFMNRQVRLVALEQELQALDCSALDYVISGDPALFDVLQRLAVAEKTEDYDTVMHCHNDLHDMNGYDAEARASKILVGLGFEHHSLRVPVKHFSGGWRVRLSLAKTLFAPSDILLLDEPTNHLDMETIVWLERFLKRYQGGIVLVSHDRDFLDQSVTHIAHIHNHQCHLYTGNYSGFELQRAQKIQLQEAQYRSQQAQLSHMKSFVDRFRAKSSKAKQAQSRLKAIERMELVDAVHRQSPFRFKFLAPAKMPSPMLTMHHADFGYEGCEVIEKINLSIMAGQRMGLLGINGAGKSTLIKGLCGELTPMAGSVEYATGLTIGYFAQHQVDALDLEASPMTLLQRLEPTIIEKDAYAYLAGFNFHRDQMLGSIRYFSGGEKSRVALALLIRQRPNLLLLDEPTNHLDMEVREALAHALQEYVGAMILVSHDRYLMRSLVDQLLFIVDGHLEQFDGSVEDYQAHCLDSVVDE